MELVATPRPACLEAPWPLPQSPSSSTVAVAVGPFATPPGYSSSESSPFALSRHAWYRSLRALRLSLPVLGADKRATVAPTAIPRIRTTKRRINLLLESVDGWILQVHSYLIREGSAEGSSVTFRIGARRSSSVPERIPRCATRKEGCARCCSVVNRSLGAVQARERRSVCGIDGGQLRLDRGEAL